MITLTLEQARERCAFWQRVLRLQDWEIKIEVVRLCDLGAGTLGECSPHACKRQARIRLLDQRDLGGQAFWFDGEAWNWEITLVHELLHLHLHDGVGEWATVPGDRQIAIERAIDAIAKALIVGEPTV